MVISRHIYLKLWRTANAKVGHITKHVSVKCRFKFSLFLLFDGLCSYRWQGDLNHGQTKHSFFLDYHTIPIVKSQLHKKLFNGRRSNYSALICTAVCSATVSGLQIMQKVE